MAEERQRETSAERSARRRKSVAWLRARASETDALHATTHALLEAARTLARYADHRASCRSAYSHLPCDCGLDDVLNTLRSASPPEAAHA